MTMWVLVLISVLPYKISAYEKASFNSMEKCFMAREVALADMGSIDGYPPINQNLICIKSNVGN